MISYKKTIASLYFMLVCFTGVFAQQNTLVNNLQQYGATAPQEKVYLHLDKPHYLTGDDIWLKGYITLGAQNQFSALSKILYVDLVDPANKVISSLKLLVLHGVSIGDMHLADTLQDGTYHLRAYTNYMRNLPEETFFNKAFTIGHPQVGQAVVQSTFTYNESAKQLQTDVKLTGQNGMQLIKVPVQYTLTFADKTTASGNAITDNAGNISIVFNNNKNLELKTGVLNLKFTSNAIITQKNIAVNVQLPENKISFMPEGGDMVAGIQSRVAFKMLQPDGFGASGSGYITDDAGTNLVDFTSGYGGMGSFFFTPEAGKKYKAVVTYADGKKQTTALPAVLSEGYNLSVMLRLPAFASLAIKVSPTLVKGQKATILVQRQGKVIYAGEKVINAAEALVRLPLDNVPSGIVQVTLFNENMQPVCERLFFNLNSHTALPLALTVNDHYQPRQAVTVTLKAGDVTDSLKAGSFSASVVNLADVSPLKSNETGILPGLLLTPELKGYVERPNHYFETFSPDRITELDNLILCQGWRRIVWDDVKAGKMPEIKYQPEKSFTIAGTATMRNGTPAAKAKIALLSTKSYVAIDTVTDANGRFVFDNLLLEENTRLALRAKEADGKHTLRLKADKQESLTGITPYSLIQYPGDVAYQTYLKDMYRLMPDSIKQRLAGYQNLKQVNIVAVRDKKALVPAYSSNLSGPGNADEVFLADEMAGKMTLTQFLQGRAAGIRFDGSVPYLSRFSPVAATGFDGGGSERMRVYVDGIRVDDDQSFTIDEVTVDDVASIEIMRSAATSALYGVNCGVMIITTKLGKSEKYAGKASPEYLPLVLTGYHAIREFYAPDYSAIKTTTPDHRITVYWKPDIITNKDGSATFKFYTTDDKGAYQICVEGMTADGRPAHVVKNINVD
jgi:hypothetical protein